MQIKLNTIYNMDCLEGIPNIPDNSIDCICADPPYFLGFTHNGQKGEFNDLQIARPFFIELAREFKRILKPTGSLYFFSDWRGYAFYYPILVSILPIQNLLVWDKRSGPGNFYNYAHEFIIYHGPGLHESGSNVIRDIKSFANGAKKTNGEKVHPTQKPIELISKFIVDSTSEGDTVLDPFMGSGTTAIAGMKTNRNYIGFEISEKYCRIAEERLWGLTD